jgi:hypothetical protein
MSSRRATRRAPARLDSLIERLSRGTPGWNVTEKRLRWLILLDEVRPDPRRILGIRQLFTVSSR